jgi:hypothetical protein
MDSKRISLIIGFVLILGAVFFFVSVDSFNFPLTLLLLITGFTSLIFGFRRN